MTFGPKLKKPTHYTKKQVLKHLDIDGEKFRLLIIYSGIYLKWPKHRRYKGKRGKAYYSKEDIQYLRNCPYYMFLLEQRKFLKKLKSLNGRRLPVEKKKAIKNKPKSNAIAMLENRYKDFVSMLFDLGDSLSILSLVYYNFGLFENVIKSYDDESKRIEKEKIYKLKNIYENFFDFVIKFKLFENVFASDTSLFFGLRIFGRSIVFRCPYVKLSKIYSEIETGEIPNGTKLDVSLEMLEDFADYNLEFISAVLSYMKNYIENSSSNEIVISKVDSKTMNQENNKLCKRDINSSEMETIANTLPETISANKKDIQINEDIGNKKYRIFEDMNFGFASSVLEGKSFEFISLAFGVNNFFDLNRLFGCNNKSLCNEDFEVKEESKGVRNYNSVEKMKSFLIQSNVTHFIVDSVELSEFEKNFGISLEQFGKENGNLEIVHFQWILDSVNREVQTPLSKYRVGKKLPVHENPFIKKNSKGKKIDRKEKILGKIMMNNAERKLYNEMKGNEND